MHFRLRRSLTCAFLLLGILGLSACGGGISGSQVDGQLDDPASRDMRDDRSEAVGFYSDGSLVNPVILPLESFSHLKIFRPRNRAWATKTLVATILNATDAFRRNFPEGDRVQVGDMASENGGDLSMHSSHQNGLDADVAYLRSNQIERDPNQWGERGFDESFVKNKRVTKNFDQRRNWFLLKEIVARGNVSRIFVDPEIKRLFCMRSEKIDPSASESIRTEVLRRLRPYPDHADHFHMRVNCPVSSPKCLTQVELPVGSGCGQVDDLADFAEHDELRGSPHL